MSKYKSYHSSIKTCFALGIQNQLLPQQLISQIPNSTSHYWKDQTPEKTIGHQHAADIQNALSDTQIFLDKRLLFARKTFIQFARIYITFITLIGKENIKLNIKNNRNIFITLIENITEYVPISKNNLLRLLLISNTSYLKFCLANL
mgnify:CR=1 FL=1